MKKIDLYLQLILTGFLVIFEVLLLKNLYSVIGVHLGVVLGLTSLLVEAFSKHKLAYSQSKCRPFLQRSITFILSILSLMAGVQFGGLF